MQETNQQVEDIGGKCLLCKVSKSLNNIEAGKNIIPSLFIQINYSIIYFQYQIVYVDILHIINSSYNSKKQLI